MTKICAVIGALVVLISIFEVHSFSYFRRCGISSPIESIALSKPVNIESLHGCSGKFHTRKYARDWNPTRMIKDPKKTFAPLVTLNYIAATSLQWGLLFGFTKLFDTRLLPLLQPYSFRGISAGSVAAALTLLTLSLRSRLFSPLDNRRPMLKNDPVFMKRQQPSWMPPRIAFPIIWSIISVLRTISGTMIFNTLGGLHVKPILCFLAHLSIGDTWNTVNNVENRLGTSSLGTLFVVSSVYYTTYQYYKTLPLAGYILSPSCLWLSIATVLVFSIWRLNKKEFGYPSFFPSREEGAPSPWKIPLLP